MEAAERGVTEVYIAFILNRKHTQAYKDMHKEHLRMHKEADANSDGVLNLEEWKVFRQKDYEWTKATHGEALECDDELQEEEYELFNKITPGVDGIT